MTVTIDERPGAFSAAECDAILALAAAGTEQEAGVQGAAGYAPDPNIRLARTTYLDRTAASDWLYERLDQLFAKAATRMGVRNAPIVEPPQAVRYDAGGHFRVWHSDAGHDLGAARRLSASVELSEPDDYAGGLLEIVPARIGGVRISPRGTITIFPSAALHRVTPVTHGTRWSLVVWAGG